MRSDLKTDYIQRDTERAGQTEKALYLLNTISAITDRGNNAEVRRKKVSAKYCYAAHESRLHQNDRCKRFALCLVLTVRFRSLAPWGKLFQLFI